MTRKKKMIATTRFMRCVICSLFFLLNYSTKSCFYLVFFAASFHFLLGIQNINAVIRESFKFVAYCAFFVQVATIHEKVSRNNFCLYSCRKQPKHPCRTVFFALNHKKRAQASGKASYN